MSKCLYLFALIVLTFGAAGACLAADPATDAPLSPPLTSDLNARFFVADVDDATALIVNPAGIGARKNFSSLIAGSYYYNRLSEFDIDFSFPNVGLGYMYQKTDIYRSNSYLLGFGARLFSQFHLGTTLTWNHTSLPTDYRSPFSVDVGFLYRPSRRLSLGGVWRNTNRPRFAGGRLEDYFNGGISIRPMTDALTLSADGIWADNAKPGWKFGGSWWLIPGVELFGAYIRNHDYAGDDLYEEYSVGITLGLGSGRVITSARNRVNGNADYGRYTFGILGTDAFMRNSLTHPPKYAEIKLSGRYVDEGGGLVLWGDKTKNLHGILRQLQTARRDDDIEGLLLEIGPIKGAFIGPVSANLYEIREAILDVRSAGKPVVAYIGEFGGAAELYIASAADRIVTPHEAIVGLIGVSLEVNRLKRTFEKLGIEWDWYTAGKYKSSFHTIYTDTTTADQAEAIQSLVDESYRLLTEAIAEGRGIDIERMREIADGRVFTHEEALEEGLVDMTGWKDEAKEELARLSGFSKPDRLVTSSIARRTYWTERWRPAPAVAVVGGYGSIRSGRSKQEMFGGDRTMGSETVVKQLKAASRYPGIKAIVFRVDSGGGSGLASDEILNEIKRIQRERKIPVVISMSNAAASGGYWISMFGDEIFADPFTITGSIGVVYFLPVLERLYEKLGVTNEVFKAGEHADAMSMRRHLTEEEMDYLAKLIDGMYDKFIDQVAEGRNMSPDRVREIAQGRVYFGSQALELGLVDRLGGLKNAVEFAAAEAGISDDYRVIYFKAFPDFWDQMRMSQELDFGSLLRNLWPERGPALVETMTVVSE
jgi:protease-4